MMSVSSRMPRPSTGWTLGVSAWMAGITAAMETALREGWTKLPLRFGDDGYQEAASVLFEQGQIHRLFRAASASTGVALDLTQSIWYSRNDEMCTVTVNIPY